MNKLLEILYQIKMEVERYKVNLTKKILKNMQFMKEPKLMQYLWNKNINIKNKRSLLDRYPKLLPDLTFLMNSSKNVLTNFKIERWNLVNEDISRRKD